MSTTPFFRNEALNSRQTKWLGEIILIRPVSFSSLTFTVAILASVLIGFFAIGTYTKHSTVAGQLIPDTGLVKVYAPQFGIVMRKLVTEGQAVRQGDVLYVLSSERQSSTQGNTQASISNQVGLRQHSLQEERDKTRQLQQSEYSAFANKIAGLETELQKLDSQIDAQKARVKLADDALARYRDLVAKHFVSAETVQQKEGDLLDQKLRLQSLERDRISVGRDLAMQQSELSSLPLKHQNQLAVIERSIAAIGQELSESEAKRDLVITAPDNGVATAVLADVGQAVDSSKPLVSIVPKGAKLQAHLYAPSKAVGFVKPGDPVLLRYQAYPYQKFGHAKGIVVSVSRTALPANEITGHMMGNQPSSSEPLYRITVNLASQAIIAYGKQKPLQAGMLLDADVLQESRQLYEWVLEPLYSQTGKL
jgi:membrane fusion protein